MERVENDRIASEQRAESERLETKAKELKAAEDKRAAEKEAQIKADAEAARKAAEPKPETTESFGSRYRTTIDCANRRMRRKPLQSIGCRV